MERTESQLQMWDSHYRIITDWQNGDAFCDLPFIANEMNKNIKTGRFDWKQPGGKDQSWKQKYSIFNTTDSWLQLTPIQKASTSTYKFKWIVVPVTIAVPVPGQSYQSNSNQLWVKIGANHALTLLASNQLQWQKCKKWHHTLLCLLYMQCYVYCLEHNCIALCNSVGLEEALCLVAFQMPSCYCQYLQTLPESQWNDTCSTDKL